MRLARLRNGRAVSNGPHDQQLKSMRESISMKDDRKVPMVTSSFRDQESADRAYSDLISRGYSDRDIHVMMSDDTQRRLGGKNIKLEHGNKAAEGAAMGGALGGAAGATILGIIAAGAAVAVPGIGLVVAGPLAGALTGGAAGAAAGGIVGTLVGMGIPEDRAKVYKSDLEQGSIVLGVRPKNEDDAEYFEDEWRTMGEHVYR
jgi:hypothetical protein